MKKSLGEYNIEQSSTADINNIRWTKKRQNITSKPKKAKKTPPPTRVPKKIKVKKPVKTIFKIKENNSVKSKEETGKQFQNASKKKGLIKPGFKRPGR
ncbi:MAG: hypothetical protein K5790_07280 [Nitrosopumilus sp.]|uniref:hypothetical protein n=1 Tax=Nitrosopumilus sp. TaxID=2024843 RepID=UPI00247E0989|nr:hypothetical protein [Nitrosopumilus sp.]MCV0393076.1 hypothetical protein [Nitrosopumilus sp.]